MSTKPKPRVMWAIPLDLEDTSFPVSVTKADAMAYSWPTDPAPIRVAVIPLDDVEAIVERAAKASLKCWQNTIGDPSLKEMTRAALTAAGIPCVVKKQRRARK